MYSGAMPAPAPSRDYWEAMLEDLVPLSTQLVTPALANAFEIPTAKASVPASQPGLLTKPAASGQTKSSYQVYGVRPNLAGAHHSLPQGYFNGHGPQFIPSQQQPLNTNEAQNQLTQHHGIMQEAQRAPDMHQAAYLGPEDEAGPQGYFGSGGHAGWHDQANGALQVLPPQPSARAHQDPGSDDPDNAEELQTRALKRPRLVWTAQLHQRFVDAVKQLGLKNAVPKTIMQLMNVDGLTRENVASHLQKYRLQLRKGEGRGEGLENAFEEDTYQDMEGFD